MDVAGVAHIPLWTLPVSTHAALGADADIGAAVEAAVSALEARP
jgi:hypothetical protein